MRNRSQCRIPPLHRVLTIAAVAALLALISPGGASAYTLKTLHAFCTSANCGDGENPNDLLQDPSGNIYGTTQHGGKYDAGLVFKLIPNADKSKYTEYILHSFCRKPNCTDGFYPYGNLIMDVDGNLYGTTVYGGSSQSGVVFKMTRVAHGWTYQVLHSFCSGNCPDGSDPNGGLSYQGQSAGAMWDEVSPLFGVTRYGGMGANLGNGVVFTITTHPYSLYLVIHKFASGRQPNPVLVDASGNLFGTTANGGKYGGGLLYKLAPNGNGTWHEATLHNFCNTTNCTDGEIPEGRLFMDGAGNLFGITGFGGSGSYCAADGGNTCGVAFERTAAGAYRVLYNFCSLPDCSDGVGPVGGLIMDASGNLLGTTFDTGSNEHDAGVVFQLTPDGTETVLYTFCLGGDPCEDGSNPATSLVLDSEGDLFGTTNNGGAHGDFGTVFELKP